MTNIYIYIYILLLYKGNRKTKNSACDAAYKNAGSRVWACYATPLLTLNGYKFSQKNINGYKKIQYILNLSTCMWL
jgi:hypothetical protein